MKIITPASFDEGDLTSDVPITETEWTAGTYNLGDKRYEGIDLYEVTAETTTDKPSVGAAKDTPSWVKIGSINRWNMFNGALHQQTIQTGGPLEVSVEVAGRVNAVAGLNIDAAEAIITMHDENSNEVYKRTISMTDNSLIRNWYEWFFGGVKRYSEFVLTDLPTYAGATITLELSSGPSEDVAIGAFVIGEQDYFGKTILNYTVRNRFFSRRERSAYGAFLDLLKRPTAREGEFAVLMESRHVSRIMNVLGERETVPSVYIGDEGYQQTILYGFPDEPEVEQISPRQSLMNITILGQT